MYINYCHFVRFMNLFLIRVLELFVYSPCSLVYVLCSLCIKACSEDSGHKFLKFVFIIGFLFLLKLTLVIAGYSIIWFLITCTLS